MQNAAPSQKKSHSLTKGSFYTTTLKTLNTQTPKSLSGA